MKEIHIKEGIFIKVDDDIASKLTNKKLYLKRTLIRRMKPYVTVGLQKNGGVMLHHFVIGSPPPGMVVDHINRDTMDNTRKNLRFCKQSENSRNAKKHSSRPTDSIFKGVVSDGGKWRARIRFEGNLYALGAWEKETDAAMAYDCAARFLFGDFAAPNFGGWELSSPENLLWLSEVTSALERILDLSSGTSQMKHGVIRSYFVINKKQFHIGSFKTKEEAHLRRIESGIDHVKGMIKEHDFWSRKEAILSKFSIADKLKFMEEMKWKL